MDALTKVEQKAKQRSRHVADGLGCSAQCPVSTAHGLRVAIGPNARHISCTRMTTLDTTWGSSCVWRVALTIADSYRQPCHSLEPSMDAAESETVGRGSGGQQNGAVLLGINCCPSYTTKYGVCV